MRHADLGVRIFLFGNLFRRPPAGASPSPPPCRLVERLETEDPSEPAACPAPALESRVWAACAGHLLWARGARYGMRTAFNTLLIEAGCSAEKTRKLIKWLREMLAIDPDMPVLFVTTRQTHADDLAAALAWAKMVKDRGQPPRRARTPHRRRRRRCDGLAQPPAPEQRRLPPRWSSPCEVRWPASPPSPTEPPCESVPHPRPHPRRWSSAERVPGSPHAPTLQRVGLRVGFALQQLRRRGDERRRLQAPDSLIHRSEAALKQPVAQPLCSFFST